MIVWISLALITIAVSLILALRSMRNFKEFPSKMKLEFAPFLVKNEEALNQDFLNKMFAHASKDYPDLIISLERLFKGNQKALVVFAPKVLMQPFVSSLGLIELEDYSQKEYGEFLVWEMGSKDQDNLINKPILKSVPVLSNLAPTEQVWWQVVIHLAKQKANLRMAAWGETNKRVQEIQNSLSSIEGLLLLPDPATLEEKLKLYRLRAFSPLPPSAKAYPLNVNSENLISLVEVN